ncbi:MAG: TonB-dependent receptor, partial [Acidobacteriaceae bacterium]|nr:TonB-dependent receptor [Acidobacteriaceae bacterium]
MHFEAENFYMQLSSLLRHAAVAFFFLLTVGNVNIASAQSTPQRSGSITGIVADQLNGLPLPAATVELYSGADALAKTKSAADGRFSFADVKPGIYTIVVRASGYAPGRSGQFSVAAQTETSQPIVLTRSSVSDQNLRSIGTVSATTTSALASTTSITRTVDITALRNENYLRFGDALRTLPGVNFAGLSSSPGDDLSVDIRGLGESETQALLDGHPVGPQGVYGINHPFGSYQGNFNYADSPFFALNKVQVTFGSGASGLYGTDSIGGTVDMETLNPTPTRQFVIEQGFGTQNKMQSDFRATGTIGRLGYALAGSVQSTLGDFSPQLIPQTGRPNNNPNSNHNGACTAGNDITSCNLALNTYQVSQGTIIKSGLAKFTYALSPNTNFLVSWFGSGSYADSTGNGDNDNIPYDTRVAQIVNNNTPNCSLPTDKGGVQTGYTVITDTNPNACYSAGQWASASSGPFGGGAGRNRGTNMFDYHA